MLAKKLLNHYNLVVITSTQNERIKNIKKLLKDREYLFLDNPKLIYEAINSGRNLEYLIVKESYSGKTDYGGEVIIVSENVFNIFSQTVNSQGIIGVLKLCKKTIDIPSGNFLILDEVQDPGNVGTLIRSALGANFKDVYLINCARISDKVVRSSMGAIFKVNVYECSKNEFINICKDKNMFYADMNGENVYNKKFIKNIGIVIGNEGNGVSDEIKSICKGSISIPMANGLESLNASVAGSIIMYQIYLRS